MKTTSKYVGLILAFFMASNSFAHYDGPKAGVNGNKGKGNSSANSDFTGKANCAPPAQKLVFEFNDVRCLLNTNGVLFLDRNENRATYEVPKGDANTPQNARVFSIYAGALWMGGVDINGQLKLAAGSNNGQSDFWTGPLTVTPGSGTYNPLDVVGDNARRDFGDANVSPEVCFEYDKFFTIRKAEVIQFSLWWEACVNPNAEPGSCTDEIEPVDNQVLQRIINWPAHGDESLNQDFYLAPFFDRNDETGAYGGDGVYNPLEQGDYPWYDDIMGKDDIECGVDRRVSLFGDETHWWIFNDKGNIHNLTGSDPIGMEVRAQAFAFATNDEVNRMTFYNFEMINRGTQTLFDTYFGLYMDADLGNYQDDYVGCDVQRGLGYIYNGDNFDEANTSSPGYGANPPALGVDFFEGPYQDADGKDNYGPGKDPITGENLPMDVSDALADGGIVYSGLGIGYNDGIVDNERYGMKVFNYFTIPPPNPSMTDPSTGAQYYNYLSGKWRFGETMYYGGNGFAQAGIPTTYAFPDDSDILDWGTNGVSTGAPWSEVSESNPVGDRRFVQSAGPFTLRPGAINNITVGIVFARGSEGDLFSSVRALKRADTKAQALFDNCFKILDPPNAPILRIQELENELILMIENPSNSNNADEDYREEDRINIPPYDGPGVEPADYRFYKFEGYQIYQVKDGNASVSDIADSDKARLVAQCDIKNGISRMVNFEFDEELGYSIPVEKVNGSNEGLRHTFQVKEDLFASGVRTLVNHKQYYFIAVAYAHNEFKRYDPNDPTLLDGQKMPYIASRINADGSSIKPIEGIPHNPRPELGGTNQNIGYGTTPQIARIDGRGNGNRVLDFTQETINTILTAGKMDEPVYDYGTGPINVKVVDPLNLKGGYYECVFKDYVNSGNDEVVNYYGTDTASWVINRYDKKGGTLQESIESKRTINNQNEQIIPEWGVSVEITQNKYYLPGNENDPPQIIEHTRYTDPIEATLDFADSSKRWLSFIPDNDGYTPQNWILSGTFDPGADTIGFNPPYVNPGNYGDEVGRDDDQNYEKLLNGGIAPHCLVNYKTEFLPLAYPIFAGGMNASNRNQIRTRNSISRLPSIDIVFTSDKSKWTRCAVIELGRDPNLAIGNARAGALRKSASVDREGNPIAGSTGMGWFPGYAVDLETGVRLHMAFGENSFLGSDNGADMIWNPSSRIFDNVGNPVVGGQHPVYVFGYNVNGNGCPEYDGTNNWVYDKLATATGAAYTDAYMSLVWVANTILSPDQTIGATDAKIRVRVNKEYTEFTATGRNNGRPMYGWSMDEIATQTASKDALAEALKLINVVPNPYYAFSEYERSRVDTRVKITNLPDVCTVNIYNMTGKLVRSYKKDSPITSIDWDLKNQKGIPIASGVYLIHVEVEGVGEVVLKFFGGVRQVDLENI